MYKKSKLQLVAIILSSLLITSNGLAASDNITLKKRKWSFDGITGKVDKASAQRGFQIYKQVCSSCHGLKYISFRNLESIGFSNEEIKALAASYEVEDGPDDTGQFFKRPGIISDRIPSPFKNEEEARAANNGAYPVDQSLIIKARADGANYMYSLMTGYSDPPANFQLGENMYYNAYFPGHQIAMAPPLADNILQYQDGTEATVEQMAVDIVNFLQWAAEPEMEKRKNLGIASIVFLIIATILFYLSKKRIWRNINSD